MNICESVPDFIQPAIPSLVKVNPEANQLIIVCRNKTLSEVDSAIAVIHSQYTSKGRISMLKTSCDNARSIRSRHNQC